MNIASRAGRWSAAHWKTATLGWLALAVCAVVAGNLAGTVNLTDSQQSTGQSARAAGILSQGGFRSHASESVLIQSRGSVVADPEFRREIQHVARRLALMPQIDSLRSPLSPRGQGQISRDRHSALVEFNMRGSADTAADRVQPVLDAVARLQRGAPAFTVAEFGDASGAHELESSTKGPREGGDPVAADHLPRSC